MRSYWILLVLITVIAYGCSKQSVVTQPEAEQTEQQQEAAQGQETIPEEKVASIGSKDISSKNIFSKNMKGGEGLFKAILFDPDKKYILFDFDRYEIDVKYKSTLRSISSWMIKNPQAKLSIEGHCDERGTNEYNLALGDRRAKAVKDYLHSLGVPSAKIDTLSYGEEKPFCREQNEACWLKNRRAHFVTLNKGGR